MLDINKILVNPTPLSIIGLIIFLMFLYLFKADKIGNKKFLPIYILLISSLTLILCLYIYSKSITQTYTIKNKESEIQINENIKNDKLISNKDTAIKTNVKPTIKSIDNSKKYALIPNNLKILELAKEKYPDPELLEIFKNFSFLYIKNSSSTIDFNINVIKKMVEELKDKQDVQAKKYLIKLLAYIAAFYTKIDEHDSSGYANFYTLQSIDIAKQFYPQDTSFKENLLTSLQILLIIYKNNNYSPATINLVQEQIDELK